MHSDYTLKFKRIRVGESTGGHDPRLKTIGGRDRDRTGDPLLAKQAEIQAKSLLRLRLSV